MAVISVIIPFYNETRTLPIILEKIASLQLVNQIQKEIIIIDDCSREDPIKIVENFTLNFPVIPVKYFRHTENRGKGAAIQTGLIAAGGDYIIIQDADLEYDPSEYNKLLQPLSDGHADVVFGSRFRGDAAHRVLFFWHSIGNKMLTFLTNIFTNLNLTDMETGFKIFKTDILKRLVLKETRFGFEPEVTCKISRIKGIRIYEVGISYYGRTYEEGKKINWKDGLRAIYCILKYGMLKQ